MKGESQHQNTLCIFVSSTVKILGLKKVISCWMWQEQESREKEEESGDGTRLNMILNSFSVTKHLVMVELQSFLASVSEGSFPSTQHNAKKAINGKVWLSFMPPVQLANKYIAHLIKLLQFHDLTTRSVHSSHLQSKSCFNFNHFDSPLELLAHYSCAYHSPKH